MPTPRKSRKIISPSVSIEVADYLRKLSSDGMNASQEVDDAIKATPGFKKFIEESKND